jgi:hypothetical protein
MPRAREQATGHTTRQAEWKLLAGGRLTRVVGDHSVGAPQTSMWRGRRGPRRTPPQAYSARLKARPTGARAATYFRVREDRVEEAGKVGLRYDGRL